jgi:DNA-binding transcriptional LysR family regulator
LDLRNVLTFLMVAQELSFAKTAHALHLSQPSVTSRIQALEAQLGKSLFIRRRRGIQLSREGEAFLPFARQMIELQTSAEETLKSLNHALAGKLMIGATAAWSVYVLPGILGNVMQSYPEIEFKVTTGNTVQIADMVQQNQADIGLVSSDIKNKQMKQIYLHEYDFVLVCSPDHAFAKTKEVSIEELLAAPLVTYEQRSDAWKSIKKAYAQYDAVPNIAMELNQIEAAKAMVGASLCVSLFPDISVRRELAEGRLVRVQVRDLEPIKQKLSLIYLEKKAAYPLIELMVETFQSHFGGGGESGNVKNKIDAI